MKRKGNVHLMIHNASIWEDVIYLSVCYIQRHGLGVRYLKYHESNVVAIILGHNHIDHSQNIIFTFDIRQANWMKKNQ